MDTPDDDGAATSSADSDDCDSVVSAIFNRPGRLVAGPAESVSPRTPRLRPSDDGRPNVFTYDAVVAPATDAGTVASTVYVLIDQGKCMGPDTRLMWYVKRLGKAQTVDRDLDAGSPEQCRIVSYVARDAHVGEKTSDAAEAEKTSDDEDDDDDDDLAADTFVMDAGTRVYFMTAVYNMVYCLDMSPSNCSVDIQRGHVMLDEMVVALKRSIKGFIRPFFVPGSNVLFEPQVYVTVIVHTPFYTSLAQQVLLQGWLINSKNYKEFIRTVTTEMNRLENALAKTKIIGNLESSSDDDDDKNDGNDDDGNDDDKNGNVDIDVGADNKNDATMRKPQDRKISNNNNSSSSHTSCKSRRNKKNNVKNSTPVANTSPDSGFINTLRYGMLALRLLPPSSMSNLIVITDGMITLADIQVLDSVLNQLRCIGIACSFLHVSSQFHPFSSHGLVPYSELMQLISTATGGFYLNSFPKTISNKVVNDYHDKFIMWSFKRGVDEFSNNTANLSCTPTCVRTGEWTVRNANFYGNRKTQLVSKKQIGTNFYVNLDNIVCCRMREGFIVEDILFRDAGSITPVKNKISSSKLELKFILPWTNHIYIEYDISIKWPCSVVSMSKPSQVQNTAVAQLSSNTSQPTKTSESDDSSKIFLTITVKGPYEFLHDITCNRAKKSQLLTELAPKYQFSLSSCRMSSVSATGISTTITRNDAIMPPENSYANNKRTVTSKYRQALISRFWSTMRSILQSDMLIKHLETYSPNTGHLVKQEPSRQQNETHDRQHIAALESQSSPPIQVDDSPSLSPNSINSVSPKIDPLESAGISETKAGNVSTPGVLKRSPLRCGIPLFYHPPSSPHNPFAIKQSQVKLNDQQGYDQQHQQFADYWKPICTLDPETQWPKWFSTYRLGGGVIILKHDQPLPAWLHMANPINNRYQTLSYREATDALLALLKHWCSFILIDDHSYVKCLDECETQNGNVSFCVAQVSLKSSTCCCVVLHLAFQSSVPVYVHQKIIDDLTNSIELLDSNTAIKPLASFDNDDELTSNHKENEEKVQEVINEIEIDSLGKSTPPPKYLHILDKPLDKILIRYERIPSQYTTVIFPDGSQPYPAPAVTTSKTSNPIKQKPKLSFGKKPIVRQEVEPTGIERKTVTTTTTLSRYLYHRRWIWSSGYKRYLKYNSNAPQMLQIQLARTLSVLTHLRLKEGFRFAHSSSGIINMVLKVDMVEGSSSCPSTPTSHCVIQYVLFPPNIPHKHRLKDQTDVIKKKSNEDERSSSTSSVDELHFWKQRLQQERNTLTSETGDSNCGCSLENTDDDYQIVMECWIEPQHGQVVPNKKLNVDYMTGLMYEQLADAIWQADFDCISSLYTFDLMQDMCLNHDVSIGHPDYDIIDAEQNKSVVVDAGRIYKMPFTFSLLNLLPKSRHQSSMTYNFFIVNDDSDSDTINDKDDNKLNKLLERSFYMRLRTINDRTFDVDGAHSTVDLSQPITKVNDQDIGQCFIKRVNSTRVILTVAPSFWEKQHSIATDSSEDGLQPLNRSRANTWHHTKRTNGILCPQFLDDSSKHYFRTLSVGSKPLKTTDMSWDQLKLDRDLSTPDAKDIENRCASVGSYIMRDFPTNLAVEIYECNKDDVQNILMFDSYSFDKNIKNIYKKSVCSSSSSTIQSDGNEEENIFTLSSKEVDSDETVDTLLLDKYIQRIGVVYDQSFVTSVFHALHLGLKVHQMDIQRAIDRCTYRLVKFEITNYIKAVCDHFKENSCNSNICPTEDSSLKSHHNLIHKTFSSVLNKHMLKTVDNLPDFFFYDFIEKFSPDTDSNECYYTGQKPTADSQTQCLPNILVGNPAHTDAEPNEVNEEDLFPLFVQFKCTVKSNETTKSQIVHSLPTCIVELMDQDNENESIQTKNLTNFKVTLDVYCFVLPNYVYDGYGYDDGDDDYDAFNKTIILEDLHYPINNSNAITSVKQIECYEKPFIYLSAVLPTQHAQGLAAFIAEVEWCMLDEMAAGLLKNPDVTPETLAKVIEYVSSSPCSSANEHQQIVLHFVPSLRTSKQTSTNLFVQKLNQMDIMLDIGNDNVDRLYTLEKSTDCLFYVVEKNMPLGPSSETETVEPKPGLPKFWIVLKVQEDKKCQNATNSGQNNSDISTLVVHIFFHCRFTELDDGGRYSAVKESVKQNVQQTATIVNQTVLLSRLHDTRICDPLLEPIIEGHYYSDDDIKDNEKMEKNIKYFTKGQFKCPVVWSTTFSLHPRIQQSTPLLVVGGVHILSAVLDKFSIRNRRNMFVYKESKSGFVFYLRFYKNSNSNKEHRTNSVIDTSLQQYDSEDDDSISRCSSASTTHSVIPSNHFSVSRKHSEDLNYADGKLNLTPVKRSFKLWATDLKDVEILTCNVHGIAPVGTEIRVDLVEVLQNRLNDAALEILTTLLHRNPSCRLFLDDVLFIQRVDGPVDVTSQISLPLETKVTKYFARTLKRTAAKFSLHPPKFFKSYHRFNYNYDTLDTIKPVIRSYFLYNQPCGGFGGRQISSKRGLSCILYDIYSHENNLAYNIYDYPMDSASFENYVKTTFMEDNSKSSTEHSGYVKMFAWCRGRVNIESLKKKIISIVSYTLWDVYVEQFLYEESVIVEEPRPHVNPLCINFLTKWIAFGARLGVPFAHYSNFECRVHMDHVLREFKTNLTWFGGYKSDKHTIVSTRYFYVPSDLHNEVKGVGRNKNVISDLFDPLHLNQERCDDAYNDLIFHEWQPPDDESVVSPPSAACVFIVVSVTYKKNASPQNEQTDNGPSDSDTDNGVCGPQTKPATNDNIEVKSPDGSNQLVKQNTDTNVKMQEVKQKLRKQCNKVSKLIMMVVSGESVHTMSYNCHKNDNQLTKVNHLSRWLELRRQVLESCTFKTIGLVNPISGSESNAFLSKIMNSYPELLLDFDSYVAYIEDPFTFENDQSELELSRSRSTSFARSTKLNDNGTDDKKKKPLLYSKDFLDKHIEKLVYMFREKVWRERQQKLLNKLYINEDGTVTEEILKAFYNNSQLYHFCLTPLLFLTQWRNESHSTRDFLMDANKSREIFSAPQPLWHKKLCVRLSNDFSRYLKTNPLFANLTLLHANDSLTINYNESSTRYYKQSVAGITGGVLMLETGVSQPFFYIKLSSVDKSMIGKQDEIKSESSLALLHQLQVINQKLHLHSFTYDFHACLLSERLYGLIQKQVLGRRSLSILMEHTNPALSSASQLENDCIKNVIAGFFDGFLKYYTDPPLYSNCLILQGVVKRTKLLVTSIQLYEYILKNCARDCDNMAVIKICDSQSVDVDDGSFLFDDDFDYDCDDSYGFGSQTKPQNKVPYDFILMRHMTGNDIQRMIKSEINSTDCSSESNKDDLYANYQHEVSGLYDVTLVMTFSVKNLVLDCRGQISLPYYVLITERDILEKKEKSSPETISERIDPRFDNNNHLLVSTSLPSSFFGNVVSFRSSTHWENAKESHSYDDMPSSKITVKTKHNPPNKLRDKKKNFIAFYQKKAAELVMLTVDSATKRCFSHLLWQKFNKFFDQQKGVPKTMTIKDVEDLINKSEFYQPLAEYNRTLAPYIETISADPHWFSVLHKLVAQQLAPSATIYSKTMRCRIFKNINNSEHQYLVILPNKCCSIELNVMVVIDNGIDSDEDVPPTASSLIHIVLKRKLIGPEQISQLMEFMGNVLIFYSWRSIQISSHSQTSIMSRVKRFFKN